MATKYLIRDDGMVIGFNASIAADSRFRLYTGVVPCTLKQGLAWLEQETGAAPAIAGEAISLNEPPPAVVSAEVVIQAAPETIDINTATKEQMIAYADQKLGRRIPDHWALDVVKRRLADMLGLEAPEESATA